MPILRPGGGFGGSTHNGDVVDQPAATAFSARRALGSVAWLGAAGVGVSGVYALTGAGLPCPWRLLTGTLCPLCGSTRLGERLLHLDLAGAWLANPFVFVLLVGLGAATVLWIVEALGGPAVRLPQVLHRQGVWYALIGGLALAFWVWRNVAG